MNKMNGTYLKKTPYLCNVKIKDALVYTQYLKLN